jgi:hypothetical protein
MILEELAAVLGIRLEGEENVRRFRESMRDAGRAVDEFAQKAGQMAAAAGAAFAALGAGLARSVIEQGMATQDLAAVLETVEGSAEGAQRSLDWVREFAKETPYDLMGVAQAFVRMRANGLDPMDGSFKAVGNAASAMGKELMEGVEAIADATRGESERLKEFGIVAETAGNQITYSWQENGETIRRTVEKDGAAITKALTEIFERRFAGAMERQSKTLRGIFTNLGDMWTDWKQLVADAGWFAYVEGRVTALRDWLKALEADGTLGRWAKMTSDAFIRVAAQAEQSLGRLIRLGREFAEWADLKNAGAPFLAFLTAIMWRAFPVAFALTAIVLALEDLQFYRESSESFLGGFIEMLKENLGVTTETAEAIAGIAAGIAALGLIKPKLILAPLFAVLRGLAFSAGFAGAGAAAGAAFVGGLVKAIVRGLAVRLIPAVAVAFAALATPAGWAVIIVGIGAALLYAFREEIAGQPWFQEGVRIGQEVVSGIAAAIGEMSGIMADPLAGTDPSGFDAEARRLFGPNATPLSQAPSNGLAAGVTPGSSTSNQNNVFNFNQTFQGGQQSTAEQAREGARAGGLDAVRALGTVAPSPSE